MWGFRFEDDSSVHEEITEITVTGGTGSVEVRPGAGPGVRIHRTVHHFRPFRPRPGASHRVDGTVLRLDTTPGSRFPFFVVVSYVVDAPAGVRVSGRLSSGRFRLTEVSTVDVSVSSGSVALTGVTGEVTVRASSGAIRGRGLRSPRIDATTTSGRISLDLVEPAHVRAHASSGSIKLTVPDGRYRVDTKVSSGSVHIGVTDDPAAPYHLDLRASSGSIRVAAR